MKKLLALMLALLLVPAAFAEAPAAPLLQVHQLMIGFADAYLIRLGDVDILMDGGNANPKTPTDDVVSYLRDAGVDTLDAVIITHWHLDHCMNLNAALAEFHRQTEPVQQLLLQDFQLNRSHEADADLLQLLAPVHMELGILLLQLAEQQQTFVEVVALRQDHPVYRKLCPRQRSLRFWYCPYSWSIP